MFEWYQKAQVCYAYLSDVFSASCFNPADQDSEFRRSKWWTRGWTLQELLAPRYLEFYDRNWLEIGTKSSLKDLISSITKISVPHLVNFRVASVAQKMSWASQRVTKRPEDEAYCLMGLFNVNMPPLYGEGHRAFHRLQLEILKQTDDESLFVWSLDSNSLPEATTAVSFYFNLYLSHASGSLFAPHVSCFAGSGDVYAGVYNPSRKPANITSKGLCVEFPVTKSTPPKHATTSQDFLMPLNCIRLAGLDMSWKNMGSRYNSNVALEVFENPTDLGPGGVGIMW